ncbi:MAG TPA: pirin [Cyclobacteriaceae bacterium]|nr:pirin [Cyclobacteriaceae bacterium]
MITEAKIYLSDKRGVTQNTLYRSYHTFHFDDYHDVSREPLESLKVLNDNTLGPGQHIVTELKDNRLIMILPIVGDVRYSSMLGPEKILTAGEAGFLSFPGGSMVEIKNPQNDLINFLHIEFQVSDRCCASAEYLHAFDLNQNKNKLITFGWCDDKSFHQVSIGKFSGRGEGKLAAERIVRGIFAFVLEGAFEVQGRLLHARDGLALKSNSEVEFEALSNDAIILFLTTRCYFTI